MPDFPAITSPRNEKIKAAVKLRRRKHRGRQGRTLIDGARELSRAIAANIQITEIYFCPAFCQTSESCLLLEQIDEFTMDVYEVAENVFEHLAFGERAEGFIAVAIPPKNDLDDLEIPRNSLVVIVEGIEKPGNLGAIVRSADGAGVSAVILADQKTDVFNPNAIRASLGTVFSMPICSAESKEVCNWLKVKDFQVIAATVDAKDSYVEVDYTVPTAIILGAESTGLSGIWQTAHPVSIPMYGVADSLNVSASAAVLFYEAQRQKAIGSQAHLVS